MTEETENPEHADDPVEDDADPKTDAVEPEDEE